MHVINKPLLSTPPSYTESQSNYIPNSAPPAYTPSNVSIISTQTSPTNIPYDQSIIIAEENKSKFKRTIDIN